MFDLRRRLWRLRRMWRRHLRHLGRRVLRELRRGLRRVCAKLRQRRLRRCRDMLELPRRLWRVHDGMRSDHVRGLLRQWGVRDRYRWGRMRPRWRRLHGLWAGPNLQRRRLRC